MNKNNEIIKQLINAIDDNTINLNNVPALLDFLEEYKKSSTQKVDEIEDKTISQINEYSTNKINKYNKQILDVLNDKLNKLIDDAEKYSLKKQDKIDQLYDNAYENAKNHVSKDINIEDLANTLKTKYKQELEELKNYSNSLNIKEKRIDKKLEKLNKFSSSNILKASLSAFLSFVLPLALASFIGIGCCYLLIMLWKG